MKGATEIFRAIAYSVLLFSAMLGAYLYFSRPGPPPHQGTGNARPPISAEQHNEEAQDKPVQIPELPLPVRSGQERPASTGNDGELRKKAEEKMKEGDFRAAIVLLTELADRDRSVFRDIGILSMKLGDYDNAVRFLEEFARENGNDFLAKKVLAFAYNLKDDPEKSLFYAEAGLSLKRDAELQVLSDRLRRERSAKQSYIREESSHFKVVFDGYEHKEVSRKVIGILEDAYKYVGNELDYFPDGPVTVILYTGKDFFDTTLAPAWAGGVYDHYDGKIRVPVRRIEGQEALLRKVLFHEYTHAVVRSITPKCPLWINEGLAEYFSGKYPKRIGQAIPLNRLEQSFTWIKSDKVFIAYWESYSAVSDIIDKYGLFRMKELLFSLSKGDDFNRAFSDVFSVSYNDFIANWGISP